jgi:hypothetical protein
MTEEEKLRQWQDPTIWALLMEVRTAIMNRYKHLPKVKRIPIPAARIQDKRVSATG